MIFKRPPRWQGEAKEGQQGVLEAIPGPAQGSAGQGHCNLDRAAAAAAAAASSLSRGESRARETRESDRIIVQLPIPAFGAAKTSKQHSLLVSDLSGPR